MAGWIKIPLGMEVGLSPGDFVLDGVHLYCGQTAGCTNMPLGAEVDLGRGDIVLDGDRAPGKQHINTIIILPLSSTFWTTLKM